MLCLLPATYVDGQANLLRTAEPSSQKSIVTGYVVEHFDLYALKSAFYSPVITANTATLLDHCRRSIAKGSTSGSHGLPLIGTGDWNDGLNLVGRDGKGESVWLAWFLVCVLNDFSDVLIESMVNDDTDVVAEAAAYRDMATTIAKAIEDTAWDGAWYRRAYFDNGDMLGSINNEECQLDSLPQSWSVISGAGDRVRAEGAMLAVLNRLVKEQERIVLLFTPPFQSSKAEPGYVKGYPPGVRENGGQYTHGSLWVPLALARPGDGDNCLALLEMMNPISHSSSPVESVRYRAEPYVVAGDVYELQGHEGRAGWSWYTGAAAWMYRIWLEEVLGFRLRGSLLSFQPCLPSTWKSVEIEYRYHSTQYSIQLCNACGVCTGVKDVTIDGLAANDGVIHLQDDGETHRVVVVME